LHFRVFGICSIPRAIVASPDRSSKTQFEKDDEEDGMKLAGCLMLLTSLSASFAPDVALAQSCPGVFIRDSQSYDNRNDKGSLERVDVVVPNGTRDTIVGYTIVGGRKFYVQFRAFLHDPSDIRLDAGCVLGRYG
jgi:hypothetical protein